jgi:hypothetical protein
MTDFNNLQTTRRLRAGVFVDSKYMQDHCFFGYLTHPGLEYDSAIAINIAVNACKFLNPNLDDKKNLKG